MGYGPWGHGCRRKREGHPQVLPRRGNHRKVPSIQQVLTYSRDRKWGIYACQPKGHRRSLSRVQPQVYAQATKTLYYRQEYLSLRRGMLRPNIP